MSVAFEPAIDAVSSQVLQWSSADISNLIGAISLAFWLCNGIPLVYEIYKNKSAEGLSLGFVGLWAIGDVLNLTGSIWAHLVPTTIIVGLYYIFSDVVIICEVLYYRMVARIKGEDTDDEEAPLLHSPTAESVVVSQKSLFIHEVLYNVGACLAVTLLGIAGWYVSMTLIKENRGDGHGNTGHGPDAENHLTAGPQILGYTSALLYLCARIPQIIKNYNKKKTDGLALLFFIFSVFGNVTYAASILIFSQDSEYLIANIPWLLGSLGTLAFDFMILAQFLLYRHRKEEVVPERSLINT